MHEKGRKAIHWQGRRDTHWERRRDHTGRKERYILEGVF